MITAAPHILCVLLWAQPGRASDLHAYEDHVLRLMAEHGGQVVQRLFIPPDGPGQPVEVQILRYPSDDAFANFMGDERRTALAGLRDRAVHRTEVLDVAWADPVITDP